MDNILIPDKFSLDGIEPNMIEVKKQGKALLTIHADGRITVSEDLKPTETAAEVLKIMRDQWLADAQATKIREQEDRIKRLEEAGDEMYKFINPPSPCMRTSRMDNLLQDWDDAKININ